FREVAGLITLTPASPSENHGSTLRVPYYLLPRVSANVSSSLPRLTGSPPSGTVTTTNKGSAIPALADFYAWGLTGVNNGNGRFGVRAVGAQEFNAGSPGQLIVFAVNTFRPWSTPAGQEVDISIDTNGDGAPDFIVFNADHGFLTNRSFDGQIISVIFNLTTQKLAFDFFAVAPTDASTILLPVRAARPGLTADSPRFTYTAEGFDFFGDGSDVVPGTAKFNAFASSISTAQGVTLEVDPDGTVTADVQVDTDEFAQTPAKGLMIVTP